MAQILDLEFEDEQLNTEEKRYEQCLKEAQEKFNPDVISEDDTGMIYYTFCCLYADCMNHEFTRYWRHRNDEAPTASSYDDDSDELKLAAECELICRLLTDRDRKLSFAAV